MPRKLFLIIAVVIVSLAAMGKGAAGQTAAGDPSKAFVHPGLLHTNQDLDRMRAKVAIGAEPWKAGWDKLTSNPHSSTNWKPRPMESIWRGTSKGHVETYPVLYNDIAAAYACALRWRISGDVAYADKSIEIMNAWSSTLKKVDGTSDRFLAAGIYGYEFANAAEIVRAYPGWKPEDFKRFQTMMLDVFYAMNHDFLLNHNGAKIDHYWCNWDACNMASMLGIGVLCDDRKIYNEAVSYFKSGKGNGAIALAVPYLYPGNLGQWQETGRDQGHNTLGIALLGSMCEMAWNQGDDLYGYDNNRFLAGAEYVAKYNLGNEVPYTSYTNSDVTQPVISDKSRGSIRPGWEMVYNHYVNRIGLSAPYSQAFADKVRPEGGGGDYGPNSGGFDQLGYGTLTFTRDKTLPPATRPIIEPESVVDAINPMALWPDDRGQHIQAHGGGVIKFQDTWYWFGEDRTKDNDHNLRHVACYSSKDLTHWTFRNQVLKLADPAALGPRWALERPKVYFNEKTHKFVMYMHLDGNSATVKSGYAAACVGTAISDTVDGDYKFIRAFRPLGKESRDIGQFIDDDGTAYLIFESRPTKGFFVAKLSDDYLDVAEETCFIKAPLEGGALVHYDALYYVVGSEMTGWKANPNKYATATKLQGPWSEFKDIAPPATNTYGSQSTMLLKVVGSESTTVIFLGDIWKPGSQWDSRYLWMPLQIGAGSLSLPEPKQWKLDVVTGKASIQQ